MIDHPEGDLAPGIAQTQLHQLGQDAAVFPLLDPDAVVGIPVAPAQVGHILQQGQPKASVGIGEQKGVLRLAHGGGVTGDGAVLRGAGLEFRSTDGHGVEGALVGKVSLRGLRLRHQAEDGLAPDGGILAKEKSRRRIAEGHLKIAALGVRGRGDLHFAPAGHALEALPEQRDKA